MSLCRMEGISAWIITGVFVLWLLRALGLICCHLNLNQLLMDQKTIPRLFCQLDNFSKWEIWAWHNYSAGRQVPGSVFIKQQAPTGHGSDCNALYHMACWLADLLMLACCLVKALLDASFEKYTGCLNIPILRVLLGDRGQRDRETRTGLQCTVEKSI